MMTREAARIEVQTMIEIFHECEPGGSRCQAALEVALSALRPVSRERVEKAFPGCRSCKSCRSCVFSIHAIKDMPCKKCDPNAEGVLTEYKPSKFCPVCGKPLTDEAVEMVMERLEADCEPKTI